MTQSINFELAKLLKQKGFNLPTVEFWYKEKSTSKEYLSTGTEYESDRNCIWDWNNNSGNGIASPYPNKMYKYQYSAPTIAEVIMWLYEKHGIWVYTSQNSKGMFQWSLDYNATGDKGMLEFNTPTEAYEAAIKYTLENLI